MAETAIVVGDRKELTFLLSQAAELEHGLMCEYLYGADAAGFQPAGLPPRPMRPEEIVPRGQDFATVGHLYRSIERGFGHLADKLGAERLFTGPAFQQADERTFGWPDLRPITGLAGANRAIERIVEQGEGARGTGRMPITAASSRCSMSTGRCATRIRPSSPRTRSPPPR